MTSSKSGEGRKFVSRQEEMKEFDFYPASSGSTPGRVGSRPFIADSRGK